MFFPSRIETSHAGVIGHAVYRQHVCCGPSVDRVSVSVTAQIIEAGNHLVLQSLVDYILAPEVAHAILNPLKIGHRYSTCIGQDVGDNEDALLMKDLISCSCRWTVCAFGQDFTLQTIGIV